MTTRKNDMHGDEGSAGSRGWLLVAALASIVGGACGGDGGAAQSGSGGGAGGGGNAGAPGSCVERPLFPSVFLSVLRSSTSASILAYPL